MGFNSSERVGKELGSFKVGSIYSSEVSGKK